MHLKKICITAAHTTQQHNTTNHMVDSVTNMVNTMEELSKKSNWANMSYSNPKVNNAILSLYCLGQASKKQLSGKLLDTFHDWNLSEEGAQKYEELEEISAYLQVIEGLGWLEHTGDWDPYLVIGTNNGDTLTFENGYWQFVLLDDEDGEIYLISSNMDDSYGEYEVKVNIRDIESINILEY